MEVSTSGIPWHNLSDIAQIVGGFSAGAGLVIAASAALLLIYQARSSAKTARETSALETHRDYLKLCIERPELTSSEALLTYLKRKDFHGILEEPVNENSERALWFISFVLHTAEQIVRTTNNDRIWRTVIKSQLSFHQELLAEVWPEWKKHYGYRMVHLVENEVLSES